jgi:protein TonB
LLKNTFIEPQKTEWRNAATGSGWMSGVQSSGREWQTNDSGKARFSPDYLPMNTASIGCGYAAAEYVAGRPVVPSIRPLPNSRLLPVLTLVLWTGFASVALLGFVVAYPLPQPKAPDPLPVQAEFLNIELSTDPQLLLDDSPRAAAAEELAMPLAPAALPQPAPAIPLQDAAFVVAEPVLQLSMEPVSHTLTPTARSERSSNAERSHGAPGNSVETIVFGRGEGRQPAPEYPFQAQRQGQQGTVQVRFMIGENGRITDADLAGPSPWPLLNEAALKAVRHTWRFSPGRQRLCQVSIHFTL